MPTLLANFEELSGGNLTVLIFWSAIVLMAVVPSAIWAVVQWRKHELDAELKREMIARGMSAGEIQQVLASKTDAKIER